MYLPVILVGSTGGLLLNPFLVCSTGGLLLYPFVVPFLTGLSHNSLTVVKLRVYPLSSFLAVKTENQLVNTKYNTQNIDTIKHYLLTLH